MLDAVFETYNIIMETLYDFKVNELLFSTVSNNYVVFCSTERSIRLRIFF